VSPVPVVGREVFEATSRRSADAAWARARDEGSVVRVADDELWLLTRYDEVCEAYRDWERFSSARTDPAVAAITVSRSQVPLGVPLELDPPEWFRYRRVVAEILTPASAEALRPRVRHWARRQLDVVAQAGRGDLVTDLTVPVPAAVTMEFLGFPEHEWLPLASVFHDIPAYPSGHPVREAAVARFGDVLAACRRELEAKRAAPGDDAVSAMARHRVDGELLDLEMLTLLLATVVGGGVDTTTAVASAALVHLGRDRELRRSLQTEPELRSTAIEEFLRLYPPVRTFARTVTTDTELGGCPLHAGERVVLSHVSANHDDRAFDHAEEFVVDRFPNRHLTFGMGIHRCPGSHLARVVLAELLAAVLDSIPDYELDADGVEEYPYWGAIGGWAHIPVTVGGPR
jgi:cytochrome P450